MTEGLGARVDVPTLYCESRTDARVARRRCSALVMRVRRQAGCGERARRPAANAKEGGRNRVMNFRRLLCCAVVQAAA